MNANFWIEFNDGRVVKWHNLPAQTARNMYTATKRSMPENTKAFGWERLT